MNFSILSVSMARVGPSPFLAGSVSSRRRVTVQKSQFRQFSSNLARFSHFKGSAEFSDTRFSQFLRSPLHFDSKEVAAQIVNQTVQFSNNDGPSVRVQSCLFQKCISAESGGAIFAAGVSLDLRVDKSSFADCDSTENQGGAICFDGVNMYISKSCFFRCESEGFGEAVDARSPTEKDLYFEGNNINYCTYMYTGESGEDGAPLNMYQGLQRVVQSNITNNIITNIYSAFQTDESDSIIITFSTFQNNTGNIVIGVEDVRSNDDISFINLIKNICPDKEYGLFYVTGKTTVRNAVFISNTDQLLHATAQVSFIFRECIFDSKYGNENNTSPVTVTFDRCTSNNKAEQYDISRFDTRYCWMINPPTLPAGPGSYWFLLVFLAFAGFVGYTTFFSYKKIKKMQIMNSSPLLVDKSGAYNEIQ